MRGQELRPSRLASNERALLVEKAVAAMQRDDCGERTHPFGFHEQSTERNGFAARQGTIE